MGDTQGGSIAGSGKNTVGNNLHRYTTGDSGTVGGNAAEFRGVRRRGGLCGGGGRRDAWWSQEEAKIPLMSTLDEISREAKMRRQGERDTQ